MSLELLKTIEKAEAQAEAVRQDAQKAARELVVEAEKRCAQEKARAAVQHRAETQNILRQARETSQRRIEQSAAAEQAEREKTCRAAREKIESAATLIFERVVGDGNR